MIGDPYFQFQPYAETLEENDPITPNDIDTIGIVFLFLQAKFTRLLFYEDADDNDNTKSFGEIGESITFTRSLQLSSHILNDNDTEAPEL